MTVLPFHPVDEKVYNFSLNTQDYGKEQQPQR